MVGSERRRRRRESEASLAAEEAACPCQQSCLCHKPKEESVYDAIFWLFPIIAVLILVGLVILTTPNQHRKIEVNGEMCEIHFKQTGITSTGAETGHNIAVCNSKTQK